MSLVIKGTETGKKYTVSTKLGMLSFLFEKPTKTIPYSIHYGPNSIYISAESHWVDSVLQTMSLEEKVGQTMMIAAYSNRSAKYYDELEGLIQRFHLGGLIFFQGNPYVQLQLTNRYQMASRIPLLIGIDAEWGLGMRLDNTMSFPKQITLGAIKENDLIEEMGYQIGLQCKRMGIHINFAPVSDINSNPRNPVINYRSFGENPMDVARKSMAYAIGMQRAGILACAKHFPGHGDTDADSHVELPLVSHSKNHLSENELVPFRSLINGGIDAVMTGHLYVPAYEQSNKVAATTSYNIVTELLQNQMGFHGLKVTDAMNMKAVSAAFPPGLAELAAYKAGNDLILQTGQLEAAYSKLLAAFKSKSLDEEELDRRIEKILKAKYKAGLSQFKELSIEHLKEDLHSSAAQVVKDQLYKKAVTLIRTEAGVLPFIHLDTLKIASVAVSAPLDNDFQKELAKFGNQTTFKMPIKPGRRSDWEYIVQKAHQYDYMIVSVHDMNGNRQRNFGVSSSTIDFIKELRQKTKVIVVAFGNPYGLQVFDQFKNLICGYEEDPSAYRAVVEVLYGARAASGKLPITASEIAQYSFGNTTANLGRLTEDIPESVGMNSKQLDEIDQIVNDGIRSNAYPGAQVLVARHGKVVYNKAFGNLRYGFDEPVTTQTIFDLASLTKVSATLQAVMMLNEKGLLDLNARASDYVPELRGSNKEDMLIIDILLHQAGLKAFIPFWANTKTGSNFNENFYSRDQKRDNLEVTEKAFIKPFVKDSVLKWIVDSELTTRSDRNGGYRYTYSDLGLIIMQHVVERITKQNLDEFLEQNLYEPLGMTRTLFNPLKKFAKETIAPTENDQAFRMQQIWGTVHDPNAALLGGVAGHAGLFSNAWDLAKLFQMNLQHGAYGGRRYLFPETVDHFSGNYTRKSHRGIGWNKPNQGIDSGNVASSASENTYGHTGFTGTVVWVDPDRQLIFIMLTNRVFPRANNNKLMQLEIRRRIHEAINRSIDGV